jgi:hypothetical protein
MTEPADLRDRPRPIRFRDLPARVRVLPADPSRPFEIAFTVESYAVPIAGADLIPFPDRIPDTSGD